MNDKVKLSYTYLSLDNMFYTNNKPTKLNKPKLILYNKDLARKLNLDFVTKQEIENFF